MFGWSLRPCSSGPTVPALRCRSCDAGPAVVALLWLALWWGPCAANPALLTLRCRPCAADPALPTLRCRTFGGCLSIFQSAINKELYKFGAWRKNKNFDGFSFWKFSMYTQDRNFLSWWFLAGNQGNHQNLEKEHLFFVREFETETSNFAPNGCPRVSN